MCDVIACVDMTWQDMVRAVCSAGLLELILHLLYNSINIIKFDFIRFIGRVSVDSLARDCAECERKADDILDEKCKLVSFTFKSKKKKKK